MGILYLVATPIGNLEDMSPRAVRVLREALLIAAEDTRHTGKLLKHFEIPTRITSYFEHNKLHKIDSILQTLGRGDVALVSDAGSPGINDPGYELVRAALAAGFDVRPVPGPSAPVAALTVSGLPSDSFLYLGYLPHKPNDRRGRLKEVAEQPYTLLFLESPYRIVEALEDMLATLGDRRIAVAREMTKMFEEYWRGSVSGALDYFKEQPARGEFTLVVEGKRKEESGKWTEEQVMAEIQKQKAKTLRQGSPSGDFAGQGKKSKELAAELAEKSGWSKKEIYQKIVNA